MIETTVIGTGKLGTTLASALAAHGFLIRALSDRSRQALEAGRRIIGSGKIYPQPEEAVTLGRLILLTLPDDAIAPAAGHLAGARQSWKECLVWHCSGLHSSEILFPFKQRGALTCSVHPILSIPEKKNDPTVFRKTPFSVEGESEAVEKSSEIIKKLGGIPFPIRAQDKPRYHAACSMVSNFLVILLDAAAKLLAGTQIPPEKTWDLIIPLAQGTLQNVNNLDTGKALTGPVIRGDMETVALHLEIIKKLPEVMPIYRVMASEALNIAEKSGRLEDEKIIRMRELLAEK